MGEGLARELVARADQLAASSCAVAGLHRPEATWLRPELRVKVTRLWTVVLLSNIAATWLIAAVLTHGPVFEPQVKEVFAQISRESIAHPFGPTVLKGIFAGWLIALMVWLLPAAEAARLWIIILITYLVSLGGFAHIIAGSVDAAYLVIISEASLGDYVFRFSLPTLIGNVLGGVTLVAILNFGQVATEIRE